MNDTKKTAKFLLCVSLGTADGLRTHTSFLTTDFKSVSSTYSDTAAWVPTLFIQLPDNSIGYEDFGVNYQPNVRQRRRRRPHLTP